MQTNHWDSSFTHSYQQQGIQHHRDKARRYRDLQLGHRIDCDILNQICKDKDLYPYVKKFKTSYDEQGAYYSIHSRWLSPNPMGLMASDTQTAHQTMTKKVRKLGEVCFLPCKIPHHP